MASKKGFGVVTGLIDAAGAGAKNDLVVQRASGTIILLDMLVASVRTSAAGPTLSRLLIVDGIITAGALSVFYNQPLTGIDGILLLDTVISSEEQPLVITPLEKLFRCYSGTLTIAQFSGSTKAGANDPAAFGYLSAMGHDEIGEGSLQFAHLR
jgi:hypothetical protein